MKTVKYNNHTYVVRQVVPCLNDEENLDIIILNNGIVDRYIDDEPVTEVVDMLEELKCSRYDTGIEVEMSVPEGREAESYSVFGKFKQMALSMISNSITPFTFLESEDTPVAEITLDDACGYWTAMDVSYNLEEKQRVRINILLTGILYVNRLPEKYRDQEVFQELIKVTLRTISRDIDDDEGNAGSEIIGLYFDLTERSPEEVEQLNSTDDDQKAH